MALKQLCKKSKVTSKKKNKILRLVFSYLFLTIVAVLIILPFYVVFITSFKPNSEALSIPFEWWPRSGKLDFSGYIEVLFGDKSGGASGGSTIVKGLLNTLIIVVPSITIWVFVSGLSAYAFAKLKFPGKNILFYALLATMAIPGIIMLSPAYVIYEELGLTNTFFPLMVPSMFGTAVCVFFLRQFFIGIPNELMEASRLDGLSNFKIFWKIFVPLAKPALLSQGILGFVSGYNDYLQPLLYLQKPEKYTLQIALSMFSGTYLAEYQSIMAGTVVSIVPTVIIFIICQRYFTKGIVMTGIKG